MLGLDMHRRAPHQIHAAGDDDGRAEQRVLVGQRVPQQPVDRHAPGQRRIFERRHGRRLAGLKATVIASWPRKPLTAKAAITHIYSARSATHSCADKVTPATAIITISQNMICSLLSVRLRMRLAMADIA